MGTQKAPFVMEVKPGDYWWCACGFSEKQPFCDGSHKTKSPGSGPLKTTIAAAKKVAWCGCKATKNPPFCDGTHSKI